MAQRWARGRRGWVVLAAVALACVPMNGRADTAPLDPTEPKTVSADPLPTAQIDGVGWAQTVVGNKVFVGGSFATVRPAGAQPGVGTSPRSNLMAYDITTGVADPSFRPVLNGQVLAMALSPDLATLYVGGDFTTVNGQWRVRLAAFDTATGALKANFRPVAGSTVRAITATANTVYFGGDFTAAGDRAGLATKARRFVAAADAATGVIRPWSPSPNASVTAMTLNYDRSKVIVAGRFTTLGGQSRYGMAAVHPATGAPLPWAATNVIRNAGTNAALTSLRSTAAGVYGTGYVFGPGGNFEGTFRADNQTGRIVWLADCHGDHYSAFPRRGVLYSAGHAHYCGNFGGFPQTDPWSFKWSTAVEDRASTVVSHNTNPGYPNFAGQPGPRQLNWFPNWTPGTFTTSKQAGWSVDGNNNYVAVAGEFLAVNGGAQQGLVRFAIPENAPKKVGPNLNQGLVPALSSHEPGQVRVGWQSSFDLDNRALTYKVYRDFSSIEDTPVFQTTAQSWFWQRPPLTFTDGGLTPGSTVQYRVAVFDPHGNYVLGDPATVVVNGEPTGLDYRRAVFADSPTAYFPLDSVPADRQLVDVAGSDPLLAANGITVDPSGALRNSAATAARFPGDAGGYAAGRVSQPAPDRFTLEAWIKTTTTEGGRIAGYSSRGKGPSSTKSSAVDRHLYMDDQGRVNFGVDRGGKRVLRTGVALNDGNWHHLVGTLGGQGMRLFVDGKFVASRDDVTYGRRYSGFWRVGGDVLPGWPDAPTSPYFAGSIDEVAVFPVQLSRRQIDRHYVASGRVSRIPFEPADPYGRAVYQKDPELYWRMEDVTGTTAADSGMADVRGVVSGGVTLQRPGALPASTGRAFGFDGASGLVVANRQNVNPQQFTIGVWLKTTTNRGGMVIGFGGASGLSAVNDRQLTMRDDGRIVFTVLSGSRRTVSSPTRLNDDTWHFVVGTMSQAGMRLYVDGQPVASNTHSTARNATGRWRIGGDRTWDSTSSYFTGTLDEAMVFTRALSPTEIAQLRALGTE